MARNLNRTKILCCNVKMRMQQNIDLDLAVWTRLWPEPTKGLSQSMSLAPMMFAGKPLGRRRMWKKRPATGSGDTDWCKWETSDGFFFKGQRLIDRVISDVGCNFKPVVKRVLICIIAHWKLTVKVRINSAWLFLLCHFQLPVLCSKRRKSDNVFFFFLTTVVKKGFWALHAFVMHYIVRRSSHTCPSRVYFSAVTNICPHAARALLRPAQDWMFQQDPLQHPECNNCKNIEQPNDVHLSVCLWYSQIFWNIHKTNSGECFMTLIWIG